jgi:hypothetical protein
MADKTTVTPMDPALQNSPLVDESDEESTVMLNGATKQCVWNGQSFADDAKVECDGDVFECSYGRWIKD